MLVYIISMACVDATYIKSPLISCVPDVGQIQYFVSKSWPYRVDV